MLLAGIRRRYGLLVRLVKVLHPICCHCSREQRLSKHVVMHVLLRAMKAMKAVKDWQIVQILTTQINAVQKLLSLSRHNR